MCSETMLSPGIAWIERHSVSIRASVERALSEKDMMDNPLVLGIIGHPVGHSLSPLMHGEAMRHWGLEGSYISFDVRPEDIQEAVAGLRALGARGVNVTIPHKQAVMDQLDELDPLAEATGAVNTIRFDGPRAFGYNTDGTGLIASIKADAGESVRGRKVLLLGAGGAARGIAVKLAQDGAAGIMVVNRTTDKGKDLVAHLKKRLSYPSAEFVPLQAEPVKALLPGVDLIINSTSVGMEGEGGLPLSPEGIDERHLVCDIVYRPLETLFLTECRKRGARTLDGLGMLICQGDLAFQIWTGKSFPKEKIRTILIEKLEANI